MLFRSLRKILQRLKDVIAAVKGQGSPIIGPITISPEDIEIGAVEIKDSTTDDRTKVIDVAPVGNEFAVVVRNIPSGTQPISAVSLPLPAGASTEATLATRLADATLTARLNVLGQNTMANSAPVVIASDQSAIPVSINNFPASDEGFVSIVNSTTTPLAGGGTFTGTGEDVTLWTTISVSVFADANANGIFKGLSLEFSPDNLNWVATQLIPYSASIAINITIPALQNWFRVRFITNSGASGAQTIFRLQTVFKSHALPAVTSQETPQSNAPGFVVRNIPSGTQAISAVSLPLPTGASTDRTTAAAPFSVELSDGAAFYIAAKTGQFPSALVGGRLDENLGAWLGSTAPTVGQKTMANSLPVVISSDQTTIPVSGTVSVTSDEGLVSTNNSSSTLLAANAFFLGTGEDVTQWSSIVISLSSDVSATGLLPGLSIQFSPDNVTYTQFDKYSYVSGVLSIAYTPVQKFFRILYTNGSSPQGTFSLQTTFKSAAITGNVRNVFPNTDEPGLVTRNIPGGTQAISAASLPLPTGAATEATLATRLADATFTARVPAALVGGRFDVNLGAWLGSTAPTIGQKVSASSLPVVIASDQTAVPVSGTVTITPSGTQTVAGNKTNNNAAPGATNIGSLGAIANAAAPVWTEGFLVAQSVDLAGNLRVINPVQLPAALVGGRLDINIGAWFGSTAPTVGSKTSANSVPVVIASDQAAVTIAGNKTNNNAAPGATNIGTLSALANAAAPTWTEGFLVALSSDLSGNQRTINPVQLPAALVGGRLDTNLGAWLGSAAPTIGQKTMANSLPVVVSSDQSTLNIQGSKTNNNAAPGATNVGVLSALANAANPAWTEGNLVNASVDLAGFQRVKPDAAVLTVTGTAAAAAGVTVTLAAVAGQFHYITFIEIEKLFSAANAAAAAPLVVTTTNLPGNPAFSFGQPAGAIGGSDTKVYVIPRPLKSSVVNTNTTIVCPATAGIIWRVNVFYYAAV